jgi:hypothetical protein
MKEEKKKRRGKILSNVNMTKAARPNENTHDE